MSAKNNTNGTAPAPVATQPEPAALPEAPASASAAMISPNGIEWLLTTRDFSVNGLLQKVKVMEDHLLKDGWTAAPPRNGRRSAAPSADAPAANGAAPVCQYHGPMKRSKKFDGWYCPQKMGDGSYCKETVKD